MPERKEQIAGEKAKRDPAALNQARAELEAAGKPFTEQDVAQRAYNNGMAASGFGTGGKYQQAIQAAMAAVQGLAGGNLRAALGGWCSTVSGWSGENHDHRPGYR
ncbi:hypothetical protein ACLBOM_08645 [Escherichia coli]